MSSHSTPILYLNMGGEMLYVLRQRLKAQRIDVDKTIQGKASLRSNNFLESASHKHFLKTTVNML